MLQHALAGMTALPQWFTWRLTWDQKKQKFIKQPCYPDGSAYLMDAQSPGNWRTFADAFETTRQLDELARSSTDGQTRYALGFMLTAASGYWFFDVDNASPETMKAWYDFLPGAFFEYSSSGRGVHFIGRGQVPEHSCRNKAMNLEFYTDGRGIAFGLSGEAWGYADTDLTMPAWAICQNYFPPGAAGQDGQFDHGPRADWDGPDDDKVLIDKALKSRSARGSFTGKASFTDLWTANRPALVRTYPDENGDPNRWGESEADAALASYLAFWTGCDAPRIERLMRKSALYRPKWDEHRTYLKELTIQRACEVCKDVYRAQPQTPEPMSTATVDDGPIMLNVQAPQVAQQLHQVCEQAAAQIAVYRTPETWIAQILAADEQALVNDVVPGIAADLGLDLFARRRLEPIVKQRLLDFQIPMGVSEIRKRLAPIAPDPDDARLEDVGGLPGWAQHYVYVTSVDMFYNKTNGELLSKQGFNATHNRNMPHRASGDREDAAKWCLERWNMVTVEDTLYRPQQPDLFSEDGRWYANEYVPMSVPATALEVSPGTRHAIELFWNHLTQLCGGREEIRDKLFTWLLHNVQKPGVKIRWSPLIKGVQGDGKSLLLQLLIQVMGTANAQPLSASAIRAEYNDWAGGAAVRGIEEIMMTGRRRHEAANDFKTNISEDSVYLNRKGRTGITVRNSTNYIAFTNHSDAVPLEDGDRRWMVVFTPWANVEQMAEALGKTSAGDVSDHLGVILDSMKTAPAEWRTWLMGCYIPEDFRPNGRAPHTDEKNLMRSAGNDEHLEIALSLIEEGGPGLSTDVVSSAHLTRAMMAVAARENLDPPRTSAVAHMMTKLGYVRGTRIKWGNDTVRPWVKSQALSRGEVRALLDSTLASERDAQKAFG